MILEARSVTKEYLQGIYALNGVDLHLERGTVYGLIGKEGSGKSSLLKLISGLSFPTSGEILFPEGKPSIGTLIELPGIFPNLTTADNLAVKMKALGCYSKEALEAHIERTGLGYWKNLKVRVFSKNILKKLGISLALVGDPELILLDEPFQDLEKEEIKEAYQLIQGLRDGKHTVILTAARLETLSGLADTYGVLENGRLVREDGEAGLSKHLPGHIVLRTSNMDETKRVLESLGIFAYQTRNAYTLYVMEQLDRKGDIIEALVSAGVQVYECAVVRESSDEFYFADDAGGQS